MGDGAPRNPHLQRLEMEAYTAVIRALAATQMDWVGCCLDNCEDTQHSMYHTMAGDV